MDALRGSTARSLFFAHHCLCHLERKLRHRRIPAALCLGLPVHWLHVSRPNVCCSSPFRSQRTRNAPCYLRRARLLILLSCTCAGVGAVSFLRVQRGGQSYTA